MVKSIYLLGASVLIGLVILYLQQKQKKEMERMSAIVSQIASTPRVEQTNQITSDFIMRENAKLHEKIEKSYEMVHRQYEQILVEIDQIVDYNGEQDDESENIRSYHCEDLIHMPSNESNKAIESVAANDEEFSNITSNIENQNEIKSITKNSVVSENIEQPKSVDDDIIEPTKEQNASVSSEKITEITEDDDAKSFLSQSTTTNYPKLAELRQICKSRGLTHSGNKGVLISRLKDNGYDF